MDNNTILETANRYMNKFVIASIDSAAACNPADKELTLTLIQNFKTSAVSIYSFAHDLILSNGDKEDTLPILNKLEALYCDTYKPAFDVALQEVKVK